MVVLILILKEPFILISMGDSVVYTPTCGKYAVLFLIFFARKGTMGREEEILKGGC